MIRRDSSSFLQRKQEQWKKEKEESESRPEWFPFGDNLTPGGGSPLRKFNAKEPTTIQTVENNDPSASMNHDFSSCPPGENQKKEEENVHEMDQHRQFHVIPPFAGHPIHHQPHHPYSYPIYTFPYPMAQSLHYQTPIVSSGANGQVENETSSQKSHILNHGNHPAYVAQQYQVIPAGAIPVSTISIDPSQICPVDQMGMWTLPPPTGPNGMRYGIPIPAPLATSIIDATKMSSSIAATDLNAMMSSASSNDSSSESGVSGVKETKKENKRIQEKKEQERMMRHEERQSTSDYTDEDPIPLTRRIITGSVTYNYADQIAERRRSEQEQEERERHELLEVERQRRILEDRRKFEEETKKAAELRRLQEEQRRSELHFLAMEKAKKEAELLKRTKLYKHVLRGAAEEGGDEKLSELEDKLLGVDIETGRRLLKEISEVEHHKKQDEVEMRKNAPQSDKTGHNSTIGNQTHHAKSSSSSSSPRHQDSTFTRTSPGRRSVRVTNREKKEIVTVEIIRNEGENRTEIYNHHPIQQPAENPRVLPSQPSHLPPQIDSPDAHRNNRSAESATPVDMMLNGFYCPVNRDPLSNEEEFRLVKTSTPLNNYCKGSTLRSTIDGLEAKSNQISQFALFGPIATRTSIRRKTMRGTGLPSPATVRVTSQKRNDDQRTSSFEESSSGGEEGGSISPDLGHKSFELALPSSTENVHPASNSPPMKNVEGAEYKTPIRARSALSSPMNNFLNGSGNQSPVFRHKTRFLERLEQRGTVRREDDLSSQGVRQTAENNLSRSPSLASLRGSIQNLSLRGSHLNLAASGELPPNLSKFSSVNSPARQSLILMKKATDRQAAVLERLGRLRESLHAGKNYASPRHGASSSRITTPAQTLPISPRPVS